MKIFLGLFTNLDSVIKDYDTGEFKGIEPVKPSNEILLEPGEVLYVLKQKHDSEHLINKKLFEFLKKNFRGKRKIGGNAGNASLILSELGTPSFLSCPTRPKSIMKILGKHKGIKVAGERVFLNPLDAARKDPEYEHLCFEGRDYRKIFTFDPVSYECMLDEYFWKKIKLADILWLCGFHLVSWKYRKKVDMVADMLAEAKCKVHLELGEGTETIRYAVKRLTDRGVLNSLGMNECETRFLGFEGNPIKDTEFFTEFLKDSCLERLTVHSKQYRITFFRKDREKNLKAGEESVKVSAAKTFGNIKENLGRVSKLERYKLKKLESKNFVIIPACVTPRPKFLTGLGDACSVVDAVISMK